MKLIGFIRHNVNLLILLICAIVLMLIAITQPPERRGDGSEYFQMMLSLSNHGTPDLRESDITEYNLLRDKTAKTSVSFEQDKTSNLASNSGYVKTKSGKTYSVHFWFYSLAAVPAKWYLQTTGLDGFKAFQITNALLLIFALYAVLFESGFSKYKKWLFSALVLFSPALWYLDWPNPEIFSYSLIVVSIAFFSSKKFSLAVFFAAFSSIQNPPVIILMAFFLIYGVADVMRSKQWVKAGVLALATLPAFAPMVFYYINYGTPNLIYKVGSASFSLISFQRTTSFFFDLNQGMMLYIPGIFILFTFLLFRNWRRKDWLAYEIAVVLLLMALMAETTTNWNSDAEGIMRYAVWMLPLLIWGVVEGYELTRKADRIMLGAVLLTQLIIVFTFPIWFIAKKENLSDPPIYVKNNYLAAYLLDSHPSLYNPVPEIFTERTLNKEVDSSRADILPVIYFRTDGTVTKILTDYAGLEGLSSHGDVDAAFLQREKDSHRGDTGVFYIDLSPGEMQFVAQDKPLTVFNAEFKVNSQPVAMVVDTVYRISVTVKNTGTETWYARGIDPINLTYQLLDKESKPVRLDNARDMIPHRLRPGEEVTMPVYLSTPEQPGIYLVDFDMVQENVSWFEPQGNKTKTIRIDVR